MENRAVSLDQSTLLRRARGSGMPPTVDERQLSRITKPQALRLQNWAQFELHISVKPACFFSPSSSQSFHFASSPNVNSINITRILAHGSPIDISVADFIPLAHAFTVSVSKHTLEADTKFMWIDVELYSNRFKFNVIPCPNFNQCRDSPRAPRKKNYRFLTYHYYKTL